MILVIAHCSVDHTECRVDDTKFFSMQILSTTISISTFKTMTKTEKYLGFLGKELSCRVIYHKCSTAKLKSRKNVGNLSNTINQSHNISFNHAKPICPAILKT